MRPNRRQVAIKRETTAGVYDAPAEADVLVKIREDTTINPSSEQIDTEEVQGSSSKSPHLIGRKEFGLDMSYLLRGAADMATDPAAAVLLGMAMFRVRPVQTIAIGAITGTFEDGEVVQSDGAGTPTGEVFRDQSGTPGTFRYVPLTGAFATAETLTGLTSGATASTSGAPVDDGRQFTLVDTDFSTNNHLCSIDYLLDGWRLAGRGCLSDLTLEFRNGHPCIVRQSILGAYQAHSDQALYALAAGYPEEAIAAPRFLKATLTLGAYQPTDLTEFSINFPQGIFLREDANDANSDAGVKHADYNRDAPVITFAPAMVKKATYDYLQTLFDGTVFAATWRLGSTAGGPLWTFYADSCQLQSAGISSREDLATVPLEMRISGKNNRDVVIHYKNNP